MSTKDAPPPPFPWLTGAKPTQRARERLSREIIVEAAYTVLDREGYEGLSMRQFAAELSTGVSSLYAHVANKEDLLRLMWLKVFLETPVPEPASNREEWAGRLREFAFTSRERLRAHRDLARLSMGHLPFEEAALPQLERLTAFLASGGLPPKLVATAGDYLSTLIEGFVAEEQIWDERARRIPEEQRDQISVWVRKYFDTLDGRRYPKIVEFAEHISPDDDNDERFGDAIEIFIRGLLSYVEEDRKA